MANQAVSGGMPAELQNSPERAAEVVVVELVLFS
jgi:hypothetical protein